MHFCSECGEIRPSAILPPSLACPGPMAHRPLHVSFRGTLPTQVMTTGPIGDEGSDMSAEVCVRAFLWENRAFSCLHWLWSSPWTAFDP